MACCHRVALLLDTAGGRDAGRRTALRLLAYLSCRLGLARLRWTFAFFDSQGARGRPARGADFGELSTRSWDSFEAALEARLFGPGAPLPGPEPRAVLTHEALLQALLDLQWDRPEIASPAKPARRPGGRRLLDAEAEAGDPAAHAVFLLAPCPHSQRELQRFVAGSEARARAPTREQLMDRLLPRRVQEALAARKITLCWVDTTEWTQLKDSPDHLGYWSVCELLRHVGGTVLPPEMFGQDFTKTAGSLLQSENKPFGEPHLSSWIPALPSDSTLTRLLYHSPQYEASFPRMEGMLFLPVEGKESQEAWAVILEPLAMQQRHFPKPVRIFLKGTVAPWAPPMSSTLVTESWMLHSPDSNRSADRLLFQQLVGRLTAEELHLVASVDPGEGWPPLSGVISPLSTTATILTVFCTEESGSQSHLHHTVVAEGSQDAASLFSSVLDVVLSQTHSPLEDSSPSAPPVPEWVQQELGRTAPWSTAVMETWFPFSNLSGASSELMESFWLLQAAPSQKEESSGTESELTQGLSEFYQKKSREESTVSNQDDSRKKRGIPRTPVRQKMKTMCRSLKMLNVARLNVKAQQLHPDGSPDASGERGIQRPAVGRRADRAEGRGRTLRISRPKDFKTEEELLSYIRESYQKTVVSRESVLHSCAQNSVSTMKAFLKSRGATDLEMSCINQIKNNLLKTSENLRQNLGKKLDKEDKVRECQLQVFLRLELCVQCPSIQESVDDLECVVEEVAALLRMVCLTEDSAYVAMFLEEILGLYIDSAPKTLGKLYDNLGFVIPQKLATALPVDFFSDDSLTQENKSPLLSGPLPSGAHPSVPGSTESDQLEELRTRSAKKRRKNALMRHKSIAEVSQNLRQIEIPKASKRAAKSESSRPPRQPPLPVKELVQEVTKVRRNLFNQEMISPSKRTSKRGLPRSHSVSTVEGLDQNFDNFRKARGYHRLLTKSVAETPVHKQISRRLLHRQIQGRSSDPGPEIDVVEESPEKGDNERILRRSPRIKQLSFMKTHSASFYSTAQPKSRSVQRVHSFQQDKSDQRENSPLRSIRSPKRLLFGAVTEMSSPSEKGLAQIQRPSGSTPGSEMSSAYQTPIKSSLKSPNSSKATSRRLPPTPQAPQCTPKRLQRPPAETTPAKRTIYKGSLRERSSSGASPGQPEAALQKGHSLVAAEGASPQESRVPKVPPKPRAQPPGFSHCSTWPPSAISSPEGFSCLAAPIPEQECLTPLGDLGETAFPGTPPSQKQQQACSPRVHPAEGPALKWEDGVAKAPSTPGNISSPPGRPWPDSPPIGQLGQNETCAAPSTPLRVSRGLKPDFSPPPPPSKTGKRRRKTSNPGRGSPECQPEISPALTGSGKPQEEARSSPASPERHSFPDAGFWSRWCGSSPLLITSDTEPLTLLEEAECHDPGRLQRDVLLGVEGEGSETALAGVKPSASDTEVPPSPPGSLLRPSLVLQCSVENRQHQATSAPLLEGSANPQTYEVELGMQVSGLPKLCIKKRKPSSDSQSEGEAPSREEGSMDEGGSLSSLGVPRGSKSCRPEATYLSPPCLLPAHSTPGKSGGQTYICQSCTPTHCPSGTSSPFQTDVGVPWTPSPKHNGKGTPESIRDWPRRKRAVDCGPAAGRGDPGAEPPEGDPESSIHRTSILGDLELEGVCQLPEQSPPWESVPQTEEATSWGQFGLGCRKRQSSAVEEAESQAKRICHPPGEDINARENEQSPRGLGWPLLSGDDDVFAPGTTPPSSGTVRSCLSASGLQALTQSPLLFQGRTPSSRAADTRDEDVDAFTPSAEESPFSRAFSRKHPINRTYTRKKLIS